MVDSAGWQTPGKDLCSTALAHKLWGSVKTTWKLCLKKQVWGHTFRVWLIDCLRTEIPHCSRNASAGLSTGLRICVTKERPGDAGVAGLGAHWGSSSCRTAPQLAWSVTWGCYCKHQRAALPQTPEMASLGRKRGSLYLYNNKRCKAIRNLQAWTTSAREAGLAF